MPKKSPKRNTGGGAAAHAGINYQDRVAAWCAVHMLAESPAVPLVSAQPVTLRFETTDPKLRVADVATGFTLTISAPGGSKRDLTASPAS